MNYKELFDVDYVSTDNFSIGKYYGTYNDCVAVSIDTVRSTTSVSANQDYFTVPNTWWVDVTVGDVTLQHVVHNSIKVWREID